MSVSSSIFVDISNHNMNITDIGHVVHQLTQRIHAKNRAEIGVGGFAKIHSYDFKSFHIVFNGESGKRGMFMCSIPQKEEVDGFVYEGEKVYISLGHNPEGIDIMKMIAGQLVEEFKDLPVFFRESDSMYHENNKWVEIK
ncbi:hypothetical protein 65p182 [Aeromonas phage 65]|uniref:Uncharacterized protein n=2 Tax=Ishigurovirus osborne TaxID=260149 RepID=A0A219YC99_9CAUD|nr:hypothetical protein ST65p182 [Aeromonas phage 65]ADQ53190.1 hypothetical protein 65p182 [Aeromonas phage 65]APU01567.1 hypothetical protein [Aeromonas phage 65.2]